MSTHTPVCELLGIDHPIVEAPMAADPRLPAAVSNDGALGTMGLWWVDDPGELVRETTCGPGWIGKFTSGRDPCGMIWARTT